MRAATGLEDGIEITAKANDTNAMAAGDRAKLQVGAKSRKTREMPYSEWRVASDGWRSFDASLEPATRHFSLTNLAQAPGLFV